MRAVQKNRVSDGWSLIEVLVSITIFSVAIGGLFLAMQTMRANIATAISRDIEASQLESKVGEVFKGDLQVEYAYNVTTRQSATLPNGETYWYTRRVLPLDIYGHPGSRYSTVYIYRNQTDTTPYRRFSKLISANTIRFNLGAADNTYIKDSMGNIWTPLDSTGEPWDGGAHRAACNYLVPTFDFDDPASHSRSGWTNTDAAVFQGGPTAYSTASAQTVPLGFSANQTLYQTGSEGVGATPAMAYLFFVNPNQRYKITLGASEVEGGVTAGVRKMDVYINGSLVGDFDAYTEAGGANIAVTKAFYYTTVYGSSNCALSVPATSIKVELRRSGTATQEPRLATITIEPAD